MPTVADTFDVVVGVDTHADTHSYAVCSRTGGVLAEATLSTSPEGLAAALGVVAEFATDPGRVVFAIEGTRSYGVGLCRAVRQAGFVVIEAEQPTRKGRRGKGKSDLIDARRAARTALELDVAKLATPRADGPRQALHILLTARRDMTDERTAKVNALRALLRTGDPTEHAWASAHLSHHLLTTIIRRRGSRDGETTEQAIRRDEARRLAQRIRELDHDLKTNKAQLAELTDQLAPGLTATRGIGPVSAAQAIVVFSHHGRCRNHGAYAKLAGTAPLDASSGKIIRHRLNRGGDRQLNKALHSIAITRSRCCPRTQAYIARRRAEGKTDREIRRCLKRYITREIYRYLNRCPALALDNT